MDAAITFCRHYVWLIPGTTVCLVVLFFIVVTIALCMKDSVNASCSFRRISFSLEAHNDEDRKPRRKQTDEAA